jgi:hypothetical protein
VQTIGALGPMLPGELRSSGITKIEPILEDEEQQPPETAAIETTQSVREVPPTPSRLPLSAPQ